MLEKFFIGHPTKKVIAPEHSPFETIQLLFETFFNILNNKRDIKKKVQTSKFRRRKIFGQKFDFVLGEHDTRGGRPPTNF